MKHGQVHYGYKSHIKVDVDHHLIRGVYIGDWVSLPEQQFFIFANSDVTEGWRYDVEVTTASVHDSDIDLSKRDEVVYRDKGYSGKETKAKGNGSMKRGIWASGNEPYVRCYTHLIGTRERQRPKGHEQKTCFLSVLASIFIAYLFHFPQHSFNSLSNLFKRYFIPLLVILTEHNLPFVSTFFNVVNR